jgi:cytochrome bd-type quinol oxidase subunit 1
MNYPVWYLPTIGGGTLIALIAIVHVFISHFAVGGGLYLVCAERKGLRENSSEILDFTKKHAKFFMLMTMVMGGITGVGIWFIISLVNPAATSILIHVFVFGWATEWVLFVVEIVSILVYYYCFGRIDPRTHQTVGWIYFIAAWFSLFLISGIIDFMLTPGAWLTDRNFWSGYFHHACRSLCICHHFIPEKCPSEIYHDAVFGQMDPGLPSRCRTERVLVCVCFAQPSSHAH